MGATRSLYEGHAREGQVAQLVEQRTENPRVGGSIPPLATILFNDLRRFQDFVKKPLREFCVTLTDV